MAKLEQPLAAGTTGMGVGIGDLVSAPGALLPGLVRRRAHTPASLNTSLSTPPAVTTGPAPGPVITSGRLRYRRVVKMNWLSVPASDAIGLDSSTTTTPTRMLRCVTTAR